MGRIIDENANALIANGMYIQIIYASNPAEIFMKRTHPLIRHFVGQYWQMAVQKTS
jgi:hypothetical protein